MSGDRGNRVEAEFYRLPGGGLIDPQGKPMSADGENIAEELPPERAGEKTPEPPASRRHERLPDDRST